MSVLTLHSVDLRFGAHVALDRLCLELDAGEFVAVTGRSGSGKSSLLNVAGGLIAPDAGGVAIAGDVLTGMRATSLAKLRRSHVGFIFQSLNLIEELSVFDNVLLPLELDKVPAKERSDLVMEALAEVELDDRASDFPADLSGGQQQRVAIARAFVQPKQLLLADEPTSALDSVTAETVMRLIRRRCQAGAAALVVTHDASQAAWADRVLRISAGHIVSTTERGESITIEAAGGAVE